MRYENIFITKGTAFSKEITVLQSNGFPLDITGFTGKITLAKHFESATKYQANATITGGTLGELRIEMPASVTNTLPNATLVYSIFVTPPGSDPILILQGQAFVTPTLI